MAAQLGVSMSEAQALALFKRFGFPGGVMPFAKWADVFVGQPNRQMGQDMAGEWKGHSRLTVCTGGGGTGWLTRRVCKCAGSVLPLFPVPAPSAPSCCVPITT